MSIKNRRKAFVAGTSWICTRGILVERGIVWVVVERGTVTTLARGGIEVTGPVTITKNGGPAPLAASTLVIDITGGTLVTYSNITLTFQGGTTSATMHFGPNAIHGVVRNVKYSDRGDSHG